MPELADTSVWARRHTAAVRPWFVARLLLNEIAVTDVVKLEILHSARTASEFEELREELDALPQARVGHTEWVRALDVLQQLSRRQPALQHRAVKPADLVIAAAAEARGWTLVHYDADFDLIGSVTGQDTRWVAARGSL